MVCRNILDRLYNKYLRETVAHSDQNTHLMNKHEYCIMSMTYRHGVRLFPLADRRMTSPERTAAELPELC